MLKERQSYNNPIKPVIECFQSFPGTSHILRHENLVFYPNPVKSIQEKLMLKNSD